MLPVGNLDPLYVRRTWVSGHQLSLACNYCWNVFNYSRELISVCILYSQLSPCGHLATPRYYRQQRNPRRKLQTFDWIKLPLLQTLTTTDLRTLYSVPRSQFYCFLSRYSRHRAHLGILTHISSLFFLLFEKLFVFVDFRCFSPSIKIPSSFSPKALFAVTLPWISSCRLWWFKWLTGQTRLLLVKIRKLWPSKLYSNEYVFQRPPFSVWKQRRVFIDLF